MHPKGGGQDEVQRLGRERFLFRFFRLFDIEFISRYQSSTSRGVVGEAAAEGLTRGAHAVVSHAILQKLTAFMFSFRVKRLVSGPRPL